MKYRLTLVVLLFSWLCFSQRSSNANFKTQIKQQFDWGYALQIPENTKDPKPLIVFLHGSGENGTDIEKVKIHGPFKFIKNNTLDAYILAPQCPENEQWNPDVLYQLLLKIQKENNIDSNRIYLTGLSSGGWGTWSLALKHPEMFAAILPISGFVDLNQLEEICKIKDIPILMYHGLRDDVVPIENAIVIYKELKKCSNTVELIISNDSGHDCWTAVYDNPETYSWLFKQIKKAN
ncbi:carboxylesterase family protein [Flavobacterium restrictum]|uniref:Prolyl oligopeptidase family serine peptidase n=1 Tax=Flavobacterium restrictum TaxID=2594428 RepID=A0A553ECX5_9FLAO|nr:prolyl oligopeptidase family serine peptidase [Flavobacterium restrictum]TRX42908.1 prolyl oligopeptidase family serine peptidase [Flavobacterium restrictum]